MRVGVVGTGRMGSGFATRLASSHQVTMGSRDPAKGAEAAASLGAAGGGSYADAIRDAEVVFLTTPWTATEETVRALAGDLAGTILVDVTNPYTADGLRPHQGTSDAELIQGWAPQARVVKGWNTIFAPVLADPDLGGERPDVFLASDDAEATATVARLATDMGFEPIDCGPLSASRDLEAMLALLGTIGHGRPYGSWALRVISRP